MSEYLHDKAYERLKVILDRDDCADIDGRLEDACKKCTSVPDRYIPHSGMSLFKCDRCGGVTFTSYPQSVPIDKSTPWVYEYVCCDCGHMMGLYMGSKD